jgi:hypothetical protein
MLVQHPSTNSVGQYLPTAWDDLVVEAVAKNLDTTSGRVDYNFADNTIDFATNARYDDEPLGHIFQMPHCWKIGTIVRPHVHWIQEENNNVNWLMAYRKLRNGHDDFSTTGYTLVKCGDPIFTYTSGSIVQICRFGDIDMTGLGVSDFLQVRLYRDSDNDSGEFAGADPYTGVGKLLQLDIHYQREDLGSVQEYSK